MDFFALSALRKDLKYTLRSVYIAGTFSKLTLTFFLVARLANIVPRSRQCFDPSRHLTRRDVAMNQHGLIIRYIIGLFFYCWFVLLINFSLCQKANCFLFVSEGVVGEFTPFGQARAQSD